VKYKPFLLSLPFGKQYMSEDYTKFGEWCGVTAKDEMIQWSGVEALSSPKTPFPFQSMT
jgi:hypothetical protein